MHDERIAFLKKRVAEFYAEWKSDPDAFRKTYPDIRFTVSRGSDPRVCAMRSIADWVMSENTRYSWDVAEFVGADPQFFITSVT